MKINKEYAVLGLVILALASYLVFRHTDRLHYRLPEIKKVETSDLTRIEITRGAGAGSVVLDRKGNDWFIDPQGWPADQEKVKGMLSVIGGLKVTDLVSESRSYDRFELDAAKKVLVKAFAGSTLKREVIVGKTASTERHTYIMLPGDEKVYLAEEDLKTIFDAAPSSLRDTVVLSFDPAEIREIQVEHEGKAVTLARQDSPGAASGTAAKASWKSDRGDAVEKVKIDTLLAVLSKIYCEAFLDDSLKPSLQHPEYAFRLKGAREYTLSVYGKNGDKVPALSSGSPSPFALPDYKLDGIKKAVQDISGRQ